jgi:hypothetical protein
MPALIIPDLVIVYPVILVMHHLPIIQVNVPIAMIRAADGITRILITVD